MLYKIAVCDDENIVIDGIVSMLRQKSSEYEIVRCNSGEALLEIKADYNILFLDIEMQGINGIETAFKLRENKYDGIIIFLTSHTEFMPDAFKVNAFRFLSKPVEADKFDEAFAAAERDIANTEHIIIKERDNSKYMRLTDIVYLEAYGDGTYIYDKNGNVYDTDKPLKYWENEIGNEHFFRISKSMIVSFLYFSSVSNDGSVYIPLYGVRLSSSRRNCKAFKEAFLRYAKKYARTI